MLFFFFFNLLIPGKRATPWPQRAIPAPDADSHERFDVAQRQVHSQRVPGYNFLRSLGRDSPFGWYSNQFTRLGSSLDPARSSWLEGDSVFTGRTPPERTAAHFQRRPSHPSRDAAGRDRSRLHLSKRLWRVTGLFHLESSLNHGITRRQHLIQSGFRHSSY